MNREHQLAYCKICKRQQMDLSQGLVCNLTGKPADFIDECPHFDEDPFLKKEQEARNLQNKVFENMASRGLRFVNYLLDIVAFFIFVVAVGFLLGVFFTFFYPTGSELLENLGFGWNMLIGVILGTIFFTLFETTTGRTPGKFITGTRVVRTDGSQPEFNTILLRSLYRYVPLEPFSFFGSEPTGWHDRWSGTVVVRHNAIPMERKPQGYYPGIGQSFAIVGLTILMMIAFIPVLILIPVFGENFTQFIYYVLAVGATFLIAHNWRRKHTSLRNYYYKIRNISVMPLLAVATVALHAGVISPLVSIIPVPDGMEDIFVTETSEFGFFGILTIVLAAPVLEELIFRGIVQEGLMHRLRPIGAIALTSLLFAFIHFNPWQFTTALIMGLFIGWIYYYTRDILLAIGVHFINNLFVVVIMWSTGQLTEDRTHTVLDSFSGALQTWLIIVASIIVLIFCLIFLHKQFNNMKLQANTIEDIPDKEEIKENKPEEYN